MTYVINPSLFGSAAAALLLDETGLGSAHAAYSVARKLRDAYSGSAIRVRRSSDSALQDIGFSGDALDESALTTFIGANDGYVATIYDQSGKGLNLTAGVGNQSRIVNAGTVIKDNGKPALEVTSSTYYNNTAGTETISSSTATLLGVANLGTADGTNYVKNIIGYGGNSNNEDHPMLRAGKFNVAGDKNKPSFTCYASGDAAISASANTAQMLLIGIGNGTSNSLYENNNSKVSATASGSLLVDDDRVAIMTQINSVGTFNQIDDYWQEGVVWLSDLDAYVSTIKSNVNAFYSIY